MRGSSAAKRSSTPLSWKRLSGTCALVLTSLFSACSPGYFDSSLKPDAGSITGTVVPFIGLLSSTSNELPRWFLRSAYADGGCATSDVSVELFRFDPTTHSKELSPLLRTSINPDGSYAFKGASGSGVSLGETGIRYSVVATGCVQGTAFERPITAFARQDITSFSSLVASLSGSYPQSAIALLTADPKTVNEFLARLDSGLGGHSTIASAFQALQSNYEMAQSFERIFGVSVSELPYSAPSILGLEAPDSLKEKEASSYSVRALHWHPSYTIRYLWKLGSETLSSEPSVIYTPDANSQGEKSLQLWVGRDDGSGGIDVSKPYFTKSWDLSIENSVPASAPSFTISGTGADGTNDRSVTLMISTGSSLRHCDSFSRLALTEEDASAPASQSSYTIRCTQTGTQSVSYSLASSGEGSKTLRLWAMDAQGNVSATPSTATIVLDSVAPSVSFSGSIPSLNRGADSLGISFTSSDGGAGIESLSLEFASDGATFSPVASLSASATSANWVIPTVNASTARLRLIATDKAGNTASATSAAFTIDSTPPSAPNATLASNSTTNQASASITVADCTDLSGIFVNTGTQPSASAPGWQSCSTSAGGITFAAPNPVEGTHALKVWSKDAAGNVSSSASSLSWTYDLTPPSAPSMSLASGTPTNSTSVALTASGCADQTHLLVNEGSKPSATDAAWQVCGTSAGGIVYTLPTNAQGSRALKIWAKDIAGNVSTSAESVTLVYDDIMPTISAFELNGGSTSSSGSVVPLSISASDGSGSGIAGYRFSLNSSFTGASWVSSPPAYYTLPFASGSRTVYAQVKDAAGNLSAASSFSVNVTLGSPPIVNLISPDGSVSYSTAGQTVSVAWAITLTSANTILTNGVDVFYSLDLGATYDAWPAGSGKSPGVNGSCTLPSGSTGCVDLSLPANLANTPFTIVLTAKDSAGNKGIIKSVLLNGTPGLSLFAGRDSSVLGGTALSTSFRYRGGMAQDPSTSDLYLGQGCEILKINAQTSIVTRWAAHPTQCSNAGNGGDLAAARFTLWASNTQGRLQFDSQGNLYWASSAGIWKWTKTTGKAEIVVGPVATPTSTATGTHRLNFSSGPTYFDLGANDRLYFHRLTNCQTVNSVAKSCVAVYRVEDDGKVTHIAGGLTGTETIPSQGADAKTVWLGSFSVKPGTAGTPDRIFVMGGGDYYSKNGLWEVLSDGTLTAIKTGIGSYVGPYLPSRNALVYGDSGNVVTIRFIDPDDPNRAMGTITSADPLYDSFRSVVDAGAGSLLIGNANGRLLSYFDADNVLTVYAGILPYAGDGGKATQAELRSPDRLSFDSAGNGYVRDLDNARVRKINSNGDISNTFYTGDNSSYNLSTGVSNQVWIQNTYGIPYSSNAYGGGTGTGKNGFATPDGVCVLACGPKSDSSYFGSSDTSANPVSLASATATTNHYLSASMASFDGASTYVYISERTSVTPYTNRTSIKKIDGSGNMSTVAGSTSLPYLASIPTLTVNSPLTSIQASSFLGWGFQVVNDVIYFLQNSDKKIYTGAVGGNWVLQSAKSSITSMVVDRRGSSTPTQNVIYYTIGTQLWMKYYTAAGGGGSEAMVVDFAGQFTAPRVLAMDPTSPRTMYFASGNSIYKYSNASLP